MTLPFANLAFAILSLGCHCHSADYSKGFENWYFNTLNAEIYYP
jgi:hypothetical protein